jgi:hypothetical protein
MGDGNLCRHQQQRYMSHFITRVFNFNLFYKFSITSLISPHIKIRRHLPRVRCGVLFPLYKIKYRNAGDSAAILCNNLESVDRTYFDERLTIFTTHDFITPSPPTFKIVTVRLSLNFIIWLGLV